MLKLYIANHLRWKSFLVAKINCNLLENICGWIIVLYGQSLLHRVFHWKSFAVTDLSMKTTKLFHVERFVIYSTSIHITSYEKLQYLKIKHFDV